MFSRQNPLGLMLVVAASRFSAAMALIIGVFAFSCTPVLATGRYVLTGQFDGTGTPNGKLLEPTAVAVDEATGDVYVVERGSHIVVKFDSEGNYISKLTGTPTGPDGALKLFNQPSLVGVENFPGPTRGDVYVVDEGSLQEGTSGGRLPPVVDQFSVTGAYLSQITGAGIIGAAGNSSPFGSITGVAAGPDGGLWLTEIGEYRSAPSRGESSVLKFDETGSSAEPWKPTLKFYDGAGVGLAGSEPLGVALDASNHVYLNHSALGISANHERWNIATVGGGPTLTEEAGVAKGGQGAQSLLAVDPLTSSVFVDQCEVSGLSCHIVKYGQFGEPEEERFGGGASLDYSLGFATNGSRHVVYATSSTGDDVAIFTELSPASPVAITGLAEGVAETTATITGEVNPEASRTIYRFEYGAGAEYGRRTSTTAAGEDAEPTSVSTELTNLTPATTYHYRVVAENVDGTVYGQDRSFTSAPLPAPTVVTGLVEGVTQTSVTLTARVDPHELLTDYAFEVGGSTVYGSRIPGVIPGVEAETVRLVLTNLVSGTTYHYRVVASNEGGAGTGEDRSFTTSAPLFAPAVAAMQLIASPEKPKVKVLAPSTPRALTRAQKLAKALKTCGKKPKKQRAGCVKKAERHYGPVAKKKSKK
jgi:hypothetical protein